MRITRLFLRNYRTFEDPVEVELPGGLVGVYGVNGAGKSALVESIPFCLYGRSRTTKDEIRTSGVGAECVVEAPTGSGDTSDGDEVVSLDALLAAFDDGEPDGSPLLRLAA